LRMDSSKASSETKWPMETAAANRIMVVGETGSVPQGYYIPTIFLNSFNATS